MSRGFEDRAADWIHFAVSDREGIVFRFASRRFTLEALREPRLPGAKSQRRTGLPLFSLWRSVKRAGCG